MLVNATHTCAYLCRPEEGVSSLRAGVVTDSCDPPSMSVVNPTLAFLEEQQMYECCLHLCICGTCMPCVFGGQKKYPENTLHWKAVKARSSQHMLSLSHLLVGKTVTLFFYNVDDQASTYQAIVLSLS